MITPNRFALALIGVALLSSCGQPNTQTNDSKESAPQKTKGSANPTEIDQSRELNYQMEVDKDIANFKKFYQNKFPEVDVTDFKDGAYTIDAATREQWLEIEEFPPYELSIDEGEEFFAVAFANGKTYADCFENGGLGIRQNFPYFDENLKRVVTLELAINQCREKNGEQALEYGSGELATISAYMAYSSRDEVFDLKVNSENAYNAYLDGKKFFYSKRGQLNFACADCHMSISGSNLRADVLSPAIGHPTSMPVYRSNWGEIGTLHKRYRECNKNVRANPLDFQSESYQNLEFFQTLMSTGFVVNGPSSRK